MRSDSVLPDRETSLALMRTMIRIREVELRIERVFLDGEVPGFAHLSIGEEAIAAGVCAAVRPTDMITSTHRGHGHTVAKGASLRGVFAELLARESGACRGRGGSMHVADFSVGMLGANAIVAGGIGIAAGAALGAKLDGSARLAVAFFGDGATGRGPFHESLNLAQVWQLPVVFVCENNGWASTTRSTDALAEPNIASRAAAAYKMNSIALDGNDVFAVYSATCDAAEYARIGNGPVLLDARTYRMRGHYIGDPDRYRSVEELEQWKGKDPIDIAEARLVEAGYADRRTREAMRNDALREIDDAVEFARASAFPAPESVGDYLFSEPLPADAAIRSVREGIASAGSAQELVTNPRRDP